jgi:TMP repeat-containing protein|nr:MAG TPA: tail tape measure [Caudoviricetes sp.]
MNNSTLTLTIRANVSALQSALKTAQASVKNFSSNVGKKLVGNAANLKDSFSQAGGFIESTLKRVAAVAVGGSFGLMSFVKSASELQSLRSSFESLTGTVEATNTVMKTLYQYGKETAFDNKSIQATAKMFLANGVAVQDLMGWMRNLGDLAGATGADLQGLALPITQAIGNGKMMTQDWYQIINQGAGGFKKYIIAAMGAGHSIQTFGDDLSKGKVTADVLRKALQMASDEGGMAFQGAIKQSRTFNGRMSNLLETITNVGMKIVGVDAATGQVKAGGVFDKISKAVEDATNWLEKNKDKIQKIADIVINNFVPAVTAAGVALVAMKVGSFAASMIQFANAIRGGKTAMEAFNLVTGKNPMLLIVAAIAAVVGALVFLQVKFNIFGKAWEAIKSAWSAAASWFGGIFNAIGQVVSDFVGGVLGFFGDIWNGIVGVFNSIVSFVQEWGLSILAVIFAPISLVIGLFFMFKDQIFVVFQAVWNFIVAVFTPIVQFFGSVFSGAWNIIVSVWNTAIGWFGGVWNGIVGVFAGVAGWFGGIFRGAWNAITGIFGGLAGFFGGVWNTITGMFGRLGSFVGNAIGGAVRGAVNGALSMVEKMANGFIGMINGAIGIINKIPGVHIGNIPSLHIPRMATGGIVTPQGGGSIIYAGDGGQNEWVVPESKMASLVTQINKRSDGVGARDVNITVNVTTRDEKFSEEDAVNIAKQINRALKAQGLRLDQLGALR